MDRLEQEHVASAGWSTYSGLIATRPDDTLDLAEIEQLLKTIVANIDTAKNRARYTMNSFVIGVGHYIKPLRTKAKSAAQKIGAVSVNMGDTACKVPLATASISKIEAADEPSKKRKTIRC